MNKRELIKSGGGFVIAVFLVGCLILSLGVIGIEGHQLPLLSSSADAGFATASPAFNPSIILEVPLLVNATGG